MKNIFKEYFNFSSSERKGIITLVLILIVLICFWKLQPLFHNTDEVDSALFEKEIDEFEKSIISNDSFRDKSEDPISLFSFNPNSLSDSSWSLLGFSEKQISSIHNYLDKIGEFKSKDDFKKLYCLKPGQYDLLESYISIPPSDGLIQKQFEKNNVIFYEFDPNCTTHEEWKKFGLTEKQISVIENYIAKGGKFKVKEDLKKIYCIQPQLYGNLEPYITIIPEPAKQPKYDPEIRVDINSADSVELIKIKGISPYLARNIVKYRNNLGGFISKKQLVEVWGFKNDTYINIEKNLTISEIPVRKINLNTASFAELIKHPYINYDITKAIIQYRKIVGKIKNLPELVNNKIVSDTIIYKIKPYLILE